MMRIVPLTLACALLALSGIVHGLWTGRWGPSVDLQAAASRCNNLPMNLDEWEGHNLEVDSRQLAVAEVAGYVSRQYVNRRTGDQVTMLLVCGRPGPISLHPPDICYRGAGYEVVGNPERRRVTLDGGSEGAEFLTAPFTKPGPAPETLRIFWSWSNTGPWLAPENPRIAFSRSPALYKLYVVRRVSRPNESPDEDPCLDFLRVLIPRLQTCLSSAS